MTSHNNPGKLYQFQTENKNTMLLWKRLSYSNFPPKPELTSTCSRLPLLRLPLPPPRHSETQGRRNKNNCSDKLQGESLTWVGGEW